MDVASLARDADERGLSRSRGISRCSSGTGTVASRQPLGDEVVGILDRVGDQSLGEESGGEGVSAADVGEGEGRPVDGVLEPVTGSAHRVARVAVP